MVQSMWLPFKFGVGGPLGNGKQIMPWIHLHDLCSLIQYIIEKPVPGVVNAVAPEITSNLEFSKVKISQLLNTNTIISYVFVRPLPKHFIARASSAFLSLLSMPSLDQSGQLWF